MTDGLQVVEDFRRQLRALPERSPRRRARAAALGVAVAVGAATLAIAPRPAPDALAVERQGGAITIRLLDASADPERLTRELREKGVRAKIETRSVAPERAGTWETVIVGSQGPRATAPPAWVRQVVVTADEVTLPAEAAADLTLVIGVAPG